MVVNNTCSAIGDVLFIETQALISGTVNFTSWSDSTTGETIDRYFTKQFRYSTNGVIFSDWLPLTTPNIVAISGTVTGILYMQFVYTRDGIDITGLLEFHSITINGGITVITCNAPTTHLSIFNNYACSNVLTANICNNFLKKLYKRGIIPEYIERGDGQNDTDYVAFWTAVSCYFAMFISFASEFGNIRNNREWLIEYLEQKGLFVCRDDVTLQDLQYLAANLYDEIRKRGTIMTIKRKGTLLQDGVTTVPVDGEILRLLCICCCKEFIFELDKINKHGWNLGNSSPMFKHTLFDEQITKGYEYTKDFITGNYQAINNILQTTAADTVNGESAIALEVFDLNSGNLSGFGTADLISPVYDYGMNVNVNMDYEITFWVKLIEPLADFTFGCFAFDCDGNRLTLEAIDGSGVTDYFKEHVQTEAGNWYFVRCIIYAKDTNNIAAPDCLLNINDGMNLRFASSDIKKITPFLLVNNQTGGNFVGSVARVWDFKVRPLRTNYSKGFLTAANLIEMWATQDNAQYSKRQVKNIIRKYLIPYNTIPIYNWLDEGIINGADINS